MLQQKNVNDIFVDSRIIIFTFFYRNTGQQNTMNKNYRVSKKPLIKESDHRVLFLGFLHGLLPIQSF